MSGVDDRPMGSDDDNSPNRPRIIPFISPPSMECVTIKGVGIPHGVTFIRGGGCHGKSTLPQALQLQVPGDGREFGVTSPFAVKIRAEDGRSVNGVDISPFIKNLPFENDAVDISLSIKNLSFGKDITCFHTSGANRSVSKARNIVEVRSSGS